MKVFSDQWPYLLPGVERSVVGVYIFWVLWGLLGVHRFYLGKVRSLLTGVVQYVFPEPMHDAPKGAGSR